MEDFKIGDIVRIINIKNNTALSILKIQNGDIGKIIAINMETVRVDFYETYTEYGFFYLRKSRFEKIS